MNNLSNSGPEPLSKRGDYTVRQPDIRNSLFILTNMKYCVQQNFWQSRRWRKVLPIVLSRFWADCTLHIIYHIFTLKNCDLSYMFFRFCFRLRRTWYGNDFLCCLKELPSMIKCFSGLAALNIGTSTKFWAKTGSCEHLSHWKYYSFRPSLPWNHFNFVCSTKIFT